MHDGTNTSLIRKIEKARIVEKVFSNAYILLVLVPDEFDFIAADEARTRL